MPIYAFTGSLTRPMPQYGAANGKGIGRFGFNDETGELRLLDVTGGVDDTAWLVTDPARGVLYATCEMTGSNQSAIASYAMEPEGRGLRLVSRQPTLGNEACHATLSRDGRFLIVASYNGATPPGYPDGSVAVFPLSAEGVLGEAVASVRHTGNGPNKDRQRMAHAHCVVPSSSGEVLYVADLGMDRLIAYALGRDGGLAPAPAKDFAFSPGLGPRHIAASPDGRSLYIISELVATVTSLAIDPNTGALSHRDAFAIDAPAGDKSQPAGLLLAPDGRHLFSSLRLTDELLVLRIGPDGRLSQTHRGPSGGRTPRDLCFSPSGRHLLVANQDSDRITVFRADHANGTLSDPIHHCDIGTPMSVKIATF